MIREGIDGVPLIRSRKINGVLLFSKVLQSFPIFRRFFFRLDCLLSIATGLSAITSRLSAVATRFARIAARFCTSHITHFLNARV